MKVRAKFVALAVGLSLALVSQARATSQLDFGVVAPTTGSISYAGGANPLKGTNISVDNVVGLNTPLNNNFLAACVSCTLSFTTGNLISSIPLVLWEFASGATTTITVKGGIPALGIAPNTTLLSGSFIGSPGNGDPMVLYLGGNMRIAGAAFLDVKNAQLAAFYGLTGGPNEPYTGFFNLSFNATGVPPNRFTSTQVLSGDIVNEPVDLPSSLLLLGSGLVGFAYLTARTRRS